MNKEEVEDLSNLISTVEYFNEKIATLQHLSNFHKIPDFLAGIEDLNLTVVKLTATLNLLTDTLE